MSDEPIETATGIVRGETTAAEFPPIALDSRPVPGRRRRRTDWRQGGQAVGRWDASVLAATAIGAGLGVVVAGLVGRIDAPWAPVVSLLTLWVGMSGAVIFAFGRGRPAGLLTLRPTDLLWGLGGGLVLRALQGVMSGANSAPFPSLVSSAGENFAAQLGYAVASAVGGPAVEEFFFRAVLLLVIYQMLRRSLGKISAALTASFASIGAFVCLHAGFSSLSLMDGLQLFLVGAVCSALVMVTGRIWGAVFAHVVYNATLILLSILGAALV